MPIAALPPLTVAVSLGLTHYQSSDYAVHLKTDCANRPMHYNSALRLTLEVSPLLDINTNQHQQVPSIKHSTLTLLRLLVLIPLGFGLSAPVKAELDCTNVPVRVALFDFAPFYSPDQQGHPQGILIDELQQIMDQIGCQWQGSFYTPSVLLEKVANSQADLAMLIEHPMLKGKAQYSRSPILEMQLASYQNSTSPGIKQVAQLRQKRVIAIRGYGYGGLINRLIDPSMQVELHMASDIRAALLMLGDGQGDYLLSYQRPTNAVLATQNRPNIHSSHLQSKDVYVVLSPEYRDSKLLDRLNRLLDSRQ